jgi:fucose 4-O-acetylase-like acetyltransferase
MEQQRYGFIDSAKGIGIILVVFAHVLAAHKVGVKIEEVITSFHMPLFFVLSGLFFSRKGSFKQFLINKTNRLIVPFVFFFAFYCIIAFAYYGYKGTLLENASSVLLGFFNEKIYIGGAIWFLMALWFVYLLFYATTLVKKELGGALLCMLIGCAGLLFGYNHIELPLWFDTALTCTPYFAMGYLIKNQTNLLKTGKYDKFDLLFFAVFLAIAIASSGYTCYRKNHYDIPFSQLYICAVAGFFSVFFLAKSKIGNFSFLQYLGKYSLIILCIHQIIMTAIRDGLVYGLHVDGWGAAFVNFAITMAACCLLIPVMCKWLPHVTGQKNLF